MTGNTARKKRYVNPGRIAFQSVNITLLVLLAAICLLPFIHVIAVSLSTTPISTPA